MVDGGMCPVYGVRLVVYGVRLVVYGVRTSGLHRWRSATLVRKGVE